SAQDTPAPRANWRTHITALGRLAWLTMPLAVVMLLASLNTNMPSYFIQAHLGEHELGVYSAMMTIAGAGGALILALGHAGSAKLSQYYAEGTMSRFWSLVLRLAGFSALVGCFGVVASILLGPALLTIIFTSEYALN